MSTRNIKQELADPRSSPTIPNTSSRAQTVSSTAETPITHGSPTARDSPTAHDTPMNLHAGSPDSQATMTNGSQPDRDEHDALKSLGAQSHRLIQGIKKLEELSISATLKSLPKFVVVGDQSAGKSSIVEALCDISLPRSMGTCTRCPFSITTSAHGPSQNDGAWSCSISIKEGFFFDKGGFKRRVGDPVVTHFANITNKERLEPMLRNAQLAVLNPRENPQQFINADNDDDAHAIRQVAFSPNIVCLEIQGPGLPELSFFDLPGTINVVGEEDDPNDQGLVQRITKLVTTFLMDEKSLVLLACGADQDVETSTTFRLIKDCKATARCVGVLTKADLMPPGKNEYIQKILDGSKFALGKGWFITKQLSQKQIDQGITHAAARDLEADFFGSQPWAQDHCGIPQLQESISRFLTQHIQGELPEILTRVENRLNEITHQLTFYPERPNHPTAIVIQEVTQIAGIIVTHVKGDEDVNPFRKAIEAVIKSFKQNLLDVKPILDVKTPGYKAPPISLDSDDEPETPTPSRTQMPVRPSATPTPSRKRPAVDTPARRPQRIKPDPAGPSLERPVYTLDSLHEAYDQGNTSGMPGNINVKVTRKLILSALESWTDAVKRLLENAEKEVLSTVHNVVDSQLSNRTSTQLYTQSRTILENFVKFHMAEASKHITWLCRCEQEKPITYSKWASTKLQRQRELELARRIQRTNEYFDTREASNNLKAGTPREKRVEKARDDAWVTKELGNDEWAEEVMNAANISAYYDTASTCFIDTVAKCLEYGVMAPLRDDVQVALLSHLNVEDAAVCTQLLAEDPERERQRTKLLAEQGKLVEAIAELKGLQV